VQVGGEGRRARITVPARGGDAFTDCVQARVIERHNDRPAIRGMAQGRGPQDIEEMMGFQVR